MLDEKKGNLLVVEDDLDLLDLIKNHLNFVGYETQGAKDSAEAMKLMETTTFDLVLTDISLPGMDGLKLTSLIKQKFSETEVIVMTGFGSQEKVIEALRAGATDYLMKPFEKMTQMSTCIERALSKKSIQKDLLDERDRFYAIVDRCGDGILVLDDSGVVLFANPSAEKLFRRSKDQLLGEYLGLPAISGTNEIDIILEGGKNGVAEIRVVDTNWKGKKAYLVMMTDITQRKTFEKNLKNQAEELEKQKNLLETIMDSMADALIVVDTQGKHILANRPSKFITGEQFIHSSPDDWHEMTFYSDSGETIPLNDLPAMKSLRGEIVDNQEVFLKNQNYPNGINLLVSSRPIFNSNAEVSSAVIIFKDITAFKNLETQFRHSQKMESIGRLAGGIAHDFNNQLGTMILCINIAEKALEKEHPVQEQLKMIHMVADKSASLVRQILAFSRKQTLSPKVLDLNIFLSDSQKTLSRLLGSNIEFEIDTLDTPQNISIDPSQLDQVLLNLAVNARDAMPNGGKLNFSLSKAPMPTINDNIEHHKEEGVLLSVRDSGTGIEKQYLENIFEPFFTTKDIGKGTGLGLSTVHGIIKQSGGEIKVESKIGKGTTFKIYFPNCKKSIDVKPEAFQHEENRGTETILMVDDEGYLLSVGTQILEGLGYTVLPASSGEQALEKYDQNKDKIDLVITDLIMPKMSGQELVEIISKDRPDLNIIFMSGFPGDDLVQKGFASKTFFLSKPFSSYALSEAINKALNKS